MRTKDFIYYASAAVLMAVTTQVASADEVVLKCLQLLKGTSINPATAADIFGGGAVLAQESPSATPSSTVAVAAIARVSNKLKYSTSQSRNNNGLSI
ncbi:MAG: hypothetical protein ACLS9T_09455 [Streptococcus salivarius]